MLSLRFWKRNQENVQVFEEIVKEIKKKEKINLFWQTKNEKTFY